MQAIPPTDALLSEIFSSIQGEGPLVGFRQLFVRFSGCNLDCRYCDTDFNPAPTCKVEELPGSGQITLWNNPVGLNRVVALAKQFIDRCPGLHHSISLTGGEPLVSVETLADWLPTLKALLPIHLETNGTLFHALGQVVADIDLISMDFKLASVSGEETPWADHRRFVEVAGDKLLCAKLVVSDSSSVAEVEEVGRIMRACSATADIILQPVTVPGQKTDIQHLFNLQEAMGRIYPQVRIIPQTHRMLNLL